VADWDRSIACAMASAWGAARFGFADFFASKKISLAACPLGLRRNPLLFRSGIQNYQRSFLILQYQETVF
jgi:hypothetical protein